MQVSTNSSPRLTVMKPLPYLLLPLATLIGFTACSSWDSSKVVERKFPAEAYTAKLQFDGKFEVLRINGQQQDTRELAAEQMKLVPGHHELELIVREYRLEGVGTIPLTVADGQVLEVTSIRDGASLNVEVWDVTDQKRDPLKIATHALNIRASAYTHIADRANNQTNGSRPLQ